MTTTNTAATKQPSTRPWPAIKGDGDGMAEPMVPVAEPVTTTNQPDYLMSFEVVFDLREFYDGNVDRATAEPILLDLIEAFLNQMGEFTGYQDVYPMDRHRQPGNRAPGDMISTLP